MTKRSDDFFPLSLVFSLLALPAPLASVRSEAASSSVARHLRLQGFLEGDAAVVVVGDYHLSVEEAAVRCVENDSAVVLALGEGAALRGIITWGGKEWSDLAIKECFKMTFSVMWLMMRQGISRIGC